MSVANRFGLPDLGLGVGLRSVHYAHILEHWPAVDWFEILSENYLARGGRSRRVLFEVAERYPVVMHGVSMSLGSTAPLDYEHLRKLKQLADETRAVWMGDHVCWTGTAHWNSHDLLPVPYDEPTLRHMIARVKEAQEILERPLVLENASTYVTFAHSTMPESVFLRELAEQADCGLLLDVNNIYVSCRNHGWDSEEYLREIPFDRVVQFHLAGHKDYGTHCIDTHSAPVVDEVWQLYGEVHRRTGGRATLLEWDQEIPTFDVVHAEVNKARRFRSAVEARP